MDGVLALLLRKLEARPELAAKMLPALPADPAGTYTWTASRRACQAIADQLTQVPAFVRLGLAHYLDQASDAQLDTFCDAIASGAGILQRERERAGADASTDGNLDPAAPLGPGPAL